MIPATMSFAPRALLCLVALFGAGWSGGALAEPRRVTIESGVVVGQTQGDLSVFKGVPYAAAPIGPLRWMPPVPPTPWTAERNADAFGPNCSQKAGAGGARNAGGISGATSEDCLYLNVWAPKLAAKAPVMVWLHGGGNTSGAGSVAIYDGSSFARDGVVLVTLNYRLGLLGFFAHPAITRAAAATQPLAAYGVMDQMAALEWVRRNIAAFGGDPANVTVFGESAGGSDILTLMAAPSAVGLFAKAIVESAAPAWSAPVSLAKREAQGEALAVQAGLGPQASLDQLRALSVESLLALPTPTVGPTVDGRLLLESPTQAFAHGHFSRIPLVIGSNSYEASLLSTLKAPPAMVLARAPASVRVAYADVANDQTKADSLFTDGVIGAPARWFAGKAGRATAWLYHFSYVAEAQRGTMPGAGHGYEIPYVFDSWDKLPEIGVLAKPSAADAEMTRIVHSCWVAFATTGRPACAGGQAWPPYTTSTDILMRFDGAAKTTTGLHDAHYAAQEAAQLPALLSTP